MSEQLKPCPMENVGYLDGKERRHCASCPNRRADPQGIVCEVDSVIDGDDRKEDGGVIVPREWIGKRVRVTLEEA